MICGIRKPSKNARQFRLPRYPF